MLLSPKFRARESPRLKMIENLNIIGVVKSIDHKKKKGIAQNSLRVNMMARRKNNNQAFVTDKK